MNIKDIAYIVAILVLGFSNVSNWFYTDSQNYRLSAYQQKQQIALESKEAKLFTASGKIGEQIASSCVIRSDGVKWVVFNKDRMIGSFGFTVHPDGKTGIEINGVSHPIESLLNKRRLGDKE